MGGFVRAVLAAGLALVFGAAALAGEGRHWRATATPVDAARIAGLDATRAQVLDEARARGAVPDIRTALRVLDAQPAPINPRQLVGQWRCRVIKLGGDPFVTPYGFFNCQVEETINGLVIHKTTGSQRFFGHLFPDDARSMVYLGAAYLPIDGKPPQAYGANPEADQAGRLYQISANEARIELPRPAFESDYDIVHLLRSPARAPGKR